MPIREKGPWHVDTWDDGSVVLQSNDFTHDVALKVTGDFATPEDRRLYADEMCQRLNLYCCDIDKE